MKIYEPWRGGGEVWIDVNQLGGKVKRAELSMDVFKTYVICMSGYMFENASFLSLSLL